MQEKFSRAFTLTELLISIAIVSILVVVSYPSYQRSIVKSRRTDGLSAAIHLQLAQERFRAQCRHYAQNLGENDECGPSATNSTLQFVDESSQGFYTLSIQTASASSTEYTIVAVPLGVQAVDSTCNPVILSITAANPNGVKTPVTCWH